MYAVRFPRFVIKVEISPFIFVYTTRALCFSLHMRLRDQFAEAVGITLDALLP